MAAVGRDRMVRNGTGEMKLTYAQAVFVLVTAAIVLLFVLGYVATGHVQ
jgi:hypothetical protein